MPRIKKEILKRLNKTCSCCGRKIKVILYKDRTYRDGHYFGKIPLYTKQELNKALKAGTRKQCLGKLNIKVLKKDPSPYTYKEHWECSKCYWGH